MIDDAAAAPRPVWWSRLAVDELPQAPYTFTRFERAPAVAEGSLLSSKAPIYWRHRQIVSAASASGSDWRSRLVLCRRCSSSMPLPKKRRKPASLQRAAGLGRASRESRRALVRSQRAGDDGEARSAPARRTLALWRACRWTWQTMHRRELAGGRHRPELRDEGGPTQASGRSAHPYLAEGRATENCRM